MINELFVCPDYVGAECVVLSVVGCVLCVRLYGGTHSVMSVCE